MRCWSGRRSTATPTTQPVREKRLLQHVSRYAPRPCRLAQPPPRLNYTLVYDNSNLTDDAARDKDLEKPGRTRFHRDAREHERVPMRRWETLPPGAPGVVEGAARPARSAASPGVSWTERPATLSSTRGKPLLYTKPRVDLQSAFGPGVHTAIHLWKLLASNAQWAEYDGNPRFVHDDIVRLVHEDQIGTVKEVRQTDTTGYLYLVQLRNGHCPIHRSARS